jgi:hypothetical protein
VRLVVIETGLVVGYVIAWALRKAKRVASQLDSEVDTALDAGLNQLHTLVAEKLGADPALTDLQDEVTSRGQVSDLIRQRMELSVQAAAGRDEAFAAAVTALVEQLQSKERAAGAVGHGAAAVTGDVNIHAEHGSAAAWQMGNVSFGSGAPPDPQRPGGSDG